MSQFGDTLVLFLLIVIIVVLILRQWVSFAFVKNWLFNKAKPPKPLQGDVPKILRNYGYEPVSEKQRIPLTIEVNDDVYESRMYIDYLAKKGEELYVVVVARERKPLRYTGAALRDYLFPYHLMFHPAGILYVDKQNRSLKVIQFQYPDPVPEEKRFPWGYVIAFLLGMIFVWLWKY